LNWVRAVLMVLSFFFLSAVLELGRSTGAQTSDKSGCKNTAKLSSSKVKPG
jgi:hypothetical protein